MEKNGQLYAPAALPHGKQLPLPLNKRLGGPQSRSGHYGEGKSILPLREIEPRFLGRLARISIPTQLQCIMDVSEATFLQIYSPEYPVLLL
jgi:hypothetical protein